MPRIFGQWYSYVNRITILSRGVANADPMMLILPKGASAIAVTLVRDSFKPLRSITRGEPADH